MILELGLQLSFKYFVNLWFIPKLFSKALDVQKTFVTAVSRHEWVKKKVLEARKELPLNVMWNIADMNTSRP